MKKLFILFAFVLVTTLTFAQSRNSINTVTVDTIQGAETVNFAVVELRSNYNVISITAVSDELGGTSDGTLTLYGSFDDTDYVFINGAADGGVVTASPKASLTGTDMNQITITDGLVANWVVNKNPYRYYRIAGVGTSGDTTIVNIKYKFQ
jgi:hypothetical protein